MYLEKLQIQGFKSFASKNELVFPGMLDKTRRGITSIVGPNGSGKSNVADAVRWALGEQSMKTLRGKKAQDIIFSGSDKKGQLGMSEVSLVLNNEDKKAPMDYSEIVITRRLYRNGDSEYMINNSRVRLSDIQMLLARSKFGQKTYSVIGQGMVEGFLNTTLAERKEFFDEATGVKQYQIKRDEALNKLRGSYENLVQAQMLVKEIEPRLKSLTRQVNRLKKRGELEQELRAHQVAYYSRAWHEISEKFNKYNSQFLELEQGKFGEEKKLERLNQDMAKLEKDGAQENKYLEWQAELDQAQAGRDELTAQLARLEARLEVKLEANGQFDLSYLSGKKEEFERETGNIEEEIKTQEERIRGYRDDEKRLNEEKAQLDEEIDELNAELPRLGQADKSKIWHRLKDKLREAIKRIKKLAHEDDLATLKLELESGVKEIEELLDQEDSDEDRAELSAGNEWQEAHERLKQLSEAKENVLNRINENTLRITARSERVRLLKEKLEQTAKDREAIEGKLKQQSGSVDYDEIEKERSRIKEALGRADERIRQAKEKQEQLSSREEAERSRLFALQKEIQARQNEINLLSQKLGEIKINSTRYETKLEDLEIEIREETGDLREVKDRQPDPELDREAAKEKIASLKRQLELIGGIDPQTEKEYEETKERYDFLSGQIKDFSQAVESLEKIIRELDVTIKEQFDQEFKIIAGNFEKYFKILFNGGQAKIIKVMDAAEEEPENMPDEESGEGGDKAAKEEPDMTLKDLKKIKFLQKHNATGLAGIEIQATPPGKKIKTISMLSGGERALTAIALICAIISSNPSPFVVLDEVDAALDEANSERLAKILDELSHKTQFILITHNRATMRRANILYGVTMGDDGVSKLLSIKLDEAGRHVGEKKEKE